MATTKTIAKSFFRPQRYPALVPIVGERSEVTQSLADTAGELLLTQIIRGELPSGSRLKTTEVSEQLGMSRTPVSKALAKLVSEGILDQQNNHQAVVSSGASDWLSQIHELRQLLEPQAAGRAVGNIPQDVMDDLLLVARDAKPTTKHEWSDAAQFFDFALHLSIAEFCENLPMKVSIRRCWLYKRLSYNLSEGCRNTLKPEYQQHIRILDALVDEDAEKASAEMSAHLQLASTRRFSARVI